MDSNMIDAKTGKHEVKVYKKTQVGNYYRYILGSGSYGVVYSTNLKTAYKSFIMMDLEWIREVVVTKYLNHPSIINYDHIGIIMDNKFDLNNRRFRKKKIYTAQAKMKYYQTMLSGLKSFNDEEILLVLNNLASALVFAHNKDVIHRDVKESNILVNISDGLISDVTLCDFGLGKFAINSDARPEYEMVTISHRPPELELSLNGDITHIFRSSEEYSKKISEIKGKHGSEECMCEKKSKYELRFRYDDRIDVWSFSMVLVFLMTGKAFYQYVHTKKLTFSDILKNLDLFYKTLSRFLGKYVNRSLKYLDFYLEILRTGLSQYEDRSSMEHMLNKINHFIKTEKIQMNRVLYKAPLSTFQSSKPISLDSNIKTINSVQFCYQKKRDFNNIYKALKEAWRPLIADIDFSSVLTKKRMENDTLYSAMMNLYHAVQEKKLCISGNISTVVSDNMMLSACYVLTNIILVDFYRNDPVCENLVKDSSIFQVIIQILELLDYNLIPSFGFLSKSPYEVKIFSPKNNSDYDTDKESLEIPDTISLVNSSPESDEIHGNQPSARTSEIKQDMPAENRNLFLKTKDLSQ